MAVDETTVKYTVRPSKSERTVTRTVDHEAFVRALAQPVLPPGFMKIRHYGWMSANSKLTLDEVGWLVWLYLGWTYWLASGHAPQSQSLTAPLRCWECGGELQCIGVTFSAMDIDDADRPLSYFDSG